MQLESGRGVATVTGGDIPARLTSRAPVATERGEPRLLPLCAGGLALLLPVLTVRVTDDPSFFGRYALLPLEAAVGIPLLWQLRHSSLRRPVVAASVTLIVCTISTLCSDNAAMSFWGTAYWGAGLLFAFAGVGVWALGASAGARGALMIERAILVGVAINAIVAVVQMFADLSKFGLANFGAQPTGLVGQPVQLGVLLLGGIWLAGRRDAWGHPTARSVSLVLAAVGIGVCGERAPLLLLPAVAVLAARRAGVRRLCATLAVVIVGAGFGIGLAHTAPSRDTVTNRFSQGFDNRPRLENYEGALRAFASRPLVGYGPGRYLTAVSPYRTESLGRSGPDQYFADAHDWPLQWLVTAGAGGALARGAWLWLSARRASGPLLGFAATVAVIGLIQPQDLAVTPLALLALGASVTSTRSLVPRGRVLHALLVAVAAVLAGIILLGGWYGYRAARGDAAAARRAAQLLPHWPDRAQVAARLSLSQPGLSTGDRLRGAVRWAESEVARDEHDPRVLGDAGYFELLANDLDAAQQLFHATLQRNPYSAHAMTGLGLVEIQRHHLDAAISWFQKALVLDPHDSLTNQFLDDARSQRGST